MTCATTDDIGLMFVALAILIITGIVFVLREIDKLKR